MKKKLIFYIFISFFLFKKSLSLSLKSALMGIGLGKFSLGLYLNRRVQSGEKLSHLEKVIFINNNQVDKKIIFCLAYPLFVIHDFLSD